MSGFLAYILIPPWVVDLIHSSSIESLGLSRFPNGKEDWEKLLCHIFVPAVKWLTDILNKTSRLGALQVSPPSPTNVLRRLGQHGQSTLENIQVKTRSLSITLRKRL